MNNGLNNAQYLMVAVHTHRDTHTDRQTDSQTVRQTDIQKQTQTDRDRYGQIERESAREKG